MRLIFWDKKAETYHREDNVCQCAVTQTVLNGHNRNCYVLYYDNTYDEKFLMKTRYELERVEA